MNCQKCHAPEKAFTDGPRSVSEGINALTGTRNAPTVLNAAYNRTQFWDGRSPSLEDQALHPFVNPVEMALPSHDALLGIVRADRDYQRSFRSVFGVGTNGVACAQCHPNAANTHPETYPKFQKQLGRVGELWEMINGCIRNPLQGTALAADDPRRIALQAYVAKERRPP